MEGVADEEEVDDQLLWNLQLLSEVIVSLCSLRGFSVELSMSKYRCPRLFVEIRFCMCSEVVFKGEQQLQWTVQEARAWQELTQIVVSCYCEMSNEVTS